MRYKKLNEGVIKDMEREAFVPTDPRNSDYKAYLKENFPTVPMRIEEFLIKELTLIIRDNYAQNLSNKNMGEILIEFGKIVKWVE